MTDWQIPCPILRSRRKWWQFWKPKIVKLTTGYGIKAYGETWKLIDRSEGVKQ